MAKTYLDPATGEQTTASAYALKHGLSKEAIYGRLARHGRIEGNVDSKGRRIPRRNSFRIQNEGFNVSLADYAKAIGTSVYSLKRWHRKHGTFDGYVKYLRQNAQAPKTFATLNGERVGLREWAKTHGFSFSAVYHWAKRHGGTIDGFHMTHNRRKKSELSDLTKQNCF